MNIRRLLFSCAALPVFLVGCSSPQSTSTPVAQAPQETPQAIETPAQTPSEAPQNPATPTAPPLKSEPRKAVPIVWNRSFSSALAEAKRSGKPMMVDFYADWCGPCKMLDSMTWPDAQVARAAEGFIAVKVDVAKQPDLQRKYKVSGLPTVMFLNARGETVASFIGFRPPKEAAVTIEAAYASAAQPPKAMPAGFRS